jgi:Glutamine cyclotransferase
VEVAALDELLQCVCLPCASIAFIALECSLGDALILRLFPKWLFPTMLVLLIALSGLTYWSTATGRIEDCGCYSGLLQIKPQHSLLLNGVYIFISLAEITPPVDKMESVANGIAYDAKGKRLFVTGKQWSKLFEIEIYPVPGMKAPAT